MFGIGRALKRAGRSVEGAARSVGRGVRRAGAQVEALGREVASGVKSGYTHPITSITNEASRAEVKGRKVVIEAGKQAEEEVKRAGDRGVVGAAKRGIQKNVQAQPEEAPPPIPEPTPMPIPDEALSMVARRRQRANRRGARGSSILSNQESLG